MTPVIEQSIDKDVLRRAAASVGLQDFPTAVMDLVSMAVPHDMRWCIVYGRAHAPVVLEHTVVAGADSGIDKVLIGEAYAQGFFRFDPFYRYWRDTAKPGVIAMADVIGQGGEDQTYLDGFMPLTGVGDDIAVMLCLNEDQSLALCLERREVFDTSERAKLAALYPLLARLADAHARVFSRFTAPHGAAPLDFDGAVAQFLPAELTERERQIVRLILTGQNNEAISVRLRISFGTVKNHRKRLYAKLDVTCERELFSLFLGFLAGLDPSELL